MGIFFGSRTMYVTKYTEKVVFMVMKNILPSVMIGLTDVLLSFLSNTLVYNQILHSSSAAAVIAC